MTSTGRETQRRRRAPAVGTLLLRPRTGPVTARLVWPSTSLVGATTGSGSRSAAVPAVLLLGPDQRALVDRASCAVRASTLAQALVLDLAWERRMGSAPVDYALGWLADHAADVDADPNRLAVTGLGSAAAAAAAAAIHARDEGWPALSQHVLVFPDQGLRWPSPDEAGRLASLVGVCECGLITHPAGAEPEYAAALRLAGVPVRNHPVAALAAADGRSDLAATTSAVAAALAALLHEVWGKPADIGSGPDTAARDVPAPTTKQSNIESKERSDRHVDRHIS